MFSKNRRPSLRFFDTIYMRRIMPPLKIFKQMNHKYIYLPIILSLCMVSPLMAKELPMKAGFDARSEVRASSTRSGEMKQVVDSKNNFWNDLREKFHRRDDNKKARIENENKDENRGKSSEAHENVLLKRIDHTYKVLNATANRLDKIASRIESRIEKIKAEGEQTTDAEASVKLAKENLAEARVHINLIVSTASSTASTTDSSIFDKIRTEAKTSKDSLIEARRNLSKAIGFIKGLERNLGNEGEGGGQASSTEASVR